MKQTLTFERPLTTVDVAIFTVHDERLRVLLVRRPTDKDEPFPDCWALPGGFVDTKQDADLKACALRKLREKAGFDAPYLEQLGSWGDAHRDPRGWSATHVYFALIPGAKTIPTGLGSAPDSRWFAIREERVVERLAFDHSDLLKAAITRLRDKVEYTSLPAFLMPAEFTLTELQRMYESVLGRILEKKAFRTRMLAAGFLEESPRRKEGANRPAQLYRLKGKSKLHLFARPFGSADRND
jgi:ADP-ribose pyrophosphatase YjhB (NUDIX family)